MKPDQNLSETRYEFAARVLKEFRPPSKVVFDLGTGNGQMRRIQEQGFEWRGFNLEASGDIQAWDLNKPCPTSEKAGAVFLLDVLEHCVSPGLTLQHISAAIEPDGILVVTMPNPRWSASRLNTFVRGYTSGFQPHDLDENHHLFPIWPHVAARLLEYAGFNVEQYVTLDGPTKLRLSRLPIDLTRKMIEFTDPGAQGMSYGLVARKVQSEMGATVHGGHAATGKLEASA